MASHDNHVGAATTWTERFIDQAVLEGQRHVHVWVPLGESRDRRRKDGAQILQLRLDSRLTPGLAELGYGGCCIPEAVKNSEVNLAQGGLAIGELEDRSRLRCGVGPYHYPGSSVGVGRGSTNRHRACRVRTHRSTDGSQQQTPQCSTAARSGLLHG